MRLTCLTVLFLAFVTAVWGQEIKKPYIDSYGQYMHRDWPGKITSDQELKSNANLEKTDLEKHPGPDCWNQYGGWKIGPKFRATGHFRTAKINGFWWLIDPEGFLFWSVGPVRVTPSSAETPVKGREDIFNSLPNCNSRSLGQFYHTHDELLRPYYIKWNKENTFDFSSANLYRKFGPDWFSLFAEQAHVRLRSWSMNTIANGSDYRIYSMNKTPWAERIELKSPPLGKAPGMWWPFRDPFDPAFHTILIEQLKTRQAEYSSPWCIGLFVDNELNWGGPCDPAKWTLAAPAEQPAKREFLNRLQKKYSSIAELNKSWSTTYANWDALLQTTALPGPGAQSDLADFSAVLIDMYFRIIREEFKKVLPNTLYLGCRFMAASASNERAVRIAAKYCDVLSFNLYAKTVDSLRLPQGIDKPVMIGEFHFGARDRGPLRPSQVEVANQEERGRAYRHFVESALRHPAFIGTHWHQFGDQATSGRFDGENFQNGLVDICDTPYSETITAARETGKSLYTVRSEKAWSGINALLKERQFGSPDYRPSLYAELPDDMFGPDALWYDHTSDSLWLTVPNFIAGTLGLPNSPPFLARIHRDGKVEKALTFPKVEGVRVGCMGIQSGPDGHLYVCDNQYFSSPDYKSRLLRIVMNQGVPTGEVQVVIKGFKVANAILWDESRVFVTDTILDLPNCYGAGGVWLFASKDILVAGTDKDHPAIQVAPRNDPRLIIVENCDDIGNNNNCGADGITKDKNGIYYFGNYGDGAMYRFRLDQNNVPEVEKIHTGGDLFRCVDGICHDPKSDKVYITDSSDNSIWAFRPQAWSTPITFELIWENDDTTGENGLLDLPCECRMVDDRLVIVNQDEGIGATGKNQKTDKPYSLSVIDVK